MLGRRNNSFERLMMTMFLIAANLIFAAAQTPRNQPVKTFESASQKLDAAAQAVRSEDFAEAEKLLKKIIAAEPKNVAARTLAGIAAERQNDLPAAEKHFAIAARLQPNSPEARNNYGAILFRLGRASEAAKEFEASLKANPNQPSAQINLAQIYFAKTTPADLLTARRMFEKVFAAAPDVEVARALIVIALRLNEKERAAKDFQQYSALAKGAALPAPARIELGASLLENNLYAEAKIELESAIALEPDNVGAIVLLARVYLAQKNIKNAGRLLESAASRGIEDAKIYAALADVYEAGGYFENAIPAMRLAIERDSRSEQYRYRYGMLLVDTKTPAAAIIRLKEAVGEFPRSAQIRLGLGIAQFYDGRLTDARQSLEKSLEFNPRLVPAFAYLAAIDNTGGQSAAAAANYERALAIDEKSAVLHFLLADTLLKDSTVDAQKVEKHLTRAIELDARIAAAHLALGRLYARQKRFAEAAAALEKTVALDANQAEAFYQLGQVYVRLKRPAESRIALAKFKELSEREKTRTKSDYSELVRRLANVKF